MTDLVPSESWYHPDFSDEGDVVLQTPAGVQFRIEASILRRSSGFFSTMFASAQPDPSPGELQTIRVEEDEKTLDVLLKIASGRYVPFTEQLVDMADIERVAHAADKYDMAAALALVRLLMHAPVAKAMPLHRYALASRYGWEDIRADAAADSLSVDIDFADVPPMDMLHLTRLLTLRQRRVTAFAAALHDPQGNFSSGNRGTCSAASHPLDKPTPWENLKRSMILDITHNPSGTTVLSDEACNRAVEKATCPKCGDHKSLWRWDMTRDNILDTISRLPKDL
ncbi:hypothetical protein AURDEDRAFT_112244 [Auricularia subglabra TFB-10046 SS5]|nr:hypothetical protein AURDEDRAFT_112244 [Auricularia subglabra TFB-10046 SS5]